MSVIRRKSGNEPIHADGKAVGGSLLDFWQWSASDLRSNATRGRLAEYLVARDLDVSGEIRREWVAHDLTSKMGTKIEVKSAAYIQSWMQRRRSLISFDIRPTLGWDPDTAKFEVERKRQADVYVFSLLSETDTEKLDPLNVAHWQFYVLAASVLNLSCPTQKTIGFNKLLSLLPERTVFGEISAAVERAANRVSNASWQAR